MSLLKDLKSQQEEMRQFKPAQNLAVFVEGYDVESSDPKEHAILGKVTNSEGVQEDVRILLAEDPLKGERKKERKEIADRAKKGVKGHVAIGGWLIAQGSFEKPDTNGVKTYQAKWLETVTPEKNKGFAGTRLATVKFIERTDRGKERVVVTSYDPARSEKVENLDVLKAKLVEALAPQHNNLGPCAIVRISQNGEAMAITANATRSLKNGEEYKSLDSGEASLDAFLKGEQAKTLLMPLFNGNEPKLPSLTIEVIPGTRFNIPNDSAEKFFEKGKLKRGDDDKKSLGEYYNSIYGEKDENGYRQPRFCETVIGVDSFLPEGSSDPKDSVPFCRNFMPLSSRPKIYEMEYMPTAHFTPDENLVKEVKQDAVESAESNAELGMSEEDADALNELDQIMEQQASTPTP